ncbi:hypothetical protein HBI30_129370 [Parastagonospora nodorum]|nr:hypothetical protein HBI30_129370 [Parastagonospora nodorum]
MAINFPLPTLEGFKDDLDCNSHIDPNSRVYEMEDKDCSICAESIFGAHEHNGHHGGPRRVRCGHLFHKTCIFQWINGINPNRNRCPNCRESLCKLNLLEPDKEAQWQAEEYARTYNPAGFSIGIYSNLMELVDMHFSRQRYVFMQRHNEDWVRIISEVRSEWVRGGCEGMRCCHEHERMEWDWFEFEVAKRVWSSLLRADLTQMPKAKLFLAFYNAMDENLQHRWFDNHPAGNDQPMQDVEENIEPVDEVVDVPHNGDNAVVGAQTSANNVDQDTVPRARVPANAHETTVARVARAQVPANNADDRIVIQDSDSGSTVSGESTRSDRQQHRSGSARPIPVFRCKGHVQQDVPRPASVSNANIRRHNSNHNPAADDDSDVDTPAVSWRGPLQDLPHGSAPVHRSASTRRSRQPTTRSPGVEADDDSDDDSDIRNPVDTLARSSTHTAYGSAATHRSASTRRSCRPTIRSPAVHRQDRLDDARHNRELRHLQQSEVLKARRKLEEQDHIVLDEVQNAGQVLRLGNMDWRVMRSNGEELCEVSGAIGYQFIGETAMFYRNKV